MQAAARTFADSGSTEHLLGDISAVLDGLMSSDNTSRLEAESFLKKMTLQSPAECLLLLAQIGAQGVGGFQLDHRLLTLILLRRVAFTELPGLFLNTNAQVATAPFDVIAERTRGRIETVLCAGLKDELDSRIRKGLGTCAAIWAKESARRQRPFILLPTILLGLSTSPRPFHRFTPYQILDTTPDLLFHSVTKPVTAEQISQLLIVGLNDQSADVRVEAIKATRSVLKCGVEDKDAAKYGPELVAECWKVIRPLPPDIIEHALGPLVDIALSAPSIVTPSFSTSLPYLISVASPPSTLTGYSFTSTQPFYLDWTEGTGAADMAVELFCALAAHNTEALTTWENGAIVKELVGALIARQIGDFAAEGETCQEWIDETDLDDELEGYPVFTEETLDRLSHSLGGETILPAVAEHAQVLLHRPEWRARYCALMALASVAEGSIKHLLPQLEQLLQLISATATDPHPRVRYGFVHCIGQLCSDCQGVMQTTYATQTLDICLQLLSDREARVRAHAAACLTNFFENADITFFQPHLDRVVETLFTVYSQGPLYLQEQVIATLCNVSTQSGEAFKPYYRRLMDMLLGILTQPSDDQHQRLVGRCIQCATFAGLAIGKQTFATDATLVAKAMMVIQNQVTEPEDSRAEFLSEGWSTLAKAIGPMFEPFLPFVIPPLLKAAQYKPPRRESGYGTTTDNNNMSVVAEVDTDDEVFEAHTAEIGEKEDAFERLAIYVSEMGGAYAPWLNDTMTITLEALTFHWSDSVKDAACYLVPGLLQVCKDANIWFSDSSNIEHLFRTMINAIANETEVYAVGQLYKSMTDSLHVMGTPLPLVNVGHLLRTTTAWLRDLRGRRLDRIAQMKSERDVKLTSDYQSDKLTGQGVEAIVTTVRDEEDPWGDMEDIDAHTEDECVAKIIQAVQVVASRVNEMGELDKTMRESLDLLEQLVQDVKRLGEEGAQF